jgi:hypothetical protein
MPFPTRPRGAGQQPLGVPLGGVVFGLGELRAQHLSDLLLAEVPAPAGAGPATWPPRCSTRPTISTNSTGEVS